MLATSSQDMVHDLGPPTQNIPTPLIADTGSTANFSTIDTPVINKRITTNPIAIKNPNGSIMYSSHEAELDFPSLPHAARHVHIVPDLEHNTLISIGQLCDAGCDVTFDAATVTVRYKNNIALTGTRTPTTRLWHLRPPPPMEHAKNAIAPADNGTCAHASLFSWHTQPLSMEHAKAAIGSATPAQIVACSIIFARTVYL